MKLTYFSNFLPYSSRFKLYVGNNTSEWDALFPVIYLLWKVYYFVFLKPKNPTKVYCKFSILISSSEVVFPPLITLLHFSKMISTNIYIYYYFDIKEKKKYLKPFLLIIKFDIIVFYLF